MGLFDKLKPKYKNSNPDVRIDGINELNDDKILFDMCLNDSVKSVRLSAFRKINSSEYWPLIVVQSNDEDIKKEAFDKITNSDDLYIVVTQSKDREIRKNAIKKISNMNILLKLKSEITDYLKVNIDNRIEELSIDEINRVTDENTLKGIVLNDNNNLNVRLTALKKITNDDILSTVYYNDSNTTIEKECLNRISNEDVLINLINHKYHIDFLRIVFNRIKLENKIKLLKSFKFTIKDDDVKEFFKEQLDQITDENAINDIARNADNSTIRVLAIEKVTDQKTLIYIAKNAEEFHIRRDAIKKITDNAVLKDIYYNDDMHFCRVAALETITDQQFLYDVFKDCDFETRGDIICNITDENLLSEIAKEESDWMVATRLALNSNNESTLTYIKNRHYSMNGTTYNQPNEAATKRLKELGYL